MSFEIAKDGENTSYPLEAEAFDLSFFSERVAVAADRLESVIVRFKSI